MDRSGRGLAAAPAAIIALVAAYEVAAGPGRVVLALVVVAPLLAATILGRAATASYVVVALAVGALLGIYDGQYTHDTWPTQAVRLFGILLGGIIAVGACSTRLQREDRLREMQTAAAAVESRARDSRQLLGLAERVQRSLLHDPPQLRHLEVEVRYLPAAEHIKVGGDWYDVFAVPDGRTMLVIGDVAGHDGAAAASMAQVRNVLRGITQVLTAPPATVLTALDQALRTLSIPTLATMILAEVDQDHRGQRRTNTAPLVLRWSNAGHPPPLLICADGTVQLLETDPELLLGVDPDTPRTDHELQLNPGDTLVLYTDGLVERRGSTIDDGLDWIQDTAAAAVEQPLHQLCDTLLRRVFDRADDDVAVLALRARTSQPLRPRFVGTTAGTGQDDPPARDPTAARAVEPTTPPRAGAGAGAGTNHEQGRTRAARPATPCSRWGRLGATHRTARLRHGYPRRRLRPTE
jgi:sigma-B regulation protein RsbU (phosphoserine phosphatase)